MQRVAVIYKTKYGSTEKYARWIAQDVNADLYKSGSVSIDSLMAYDTIVYCGGLYAGGMLGFSSIKKNYGRLSRKKLIVVAVGATTKNEAAAKEIKEKNLTAEMKDNIPFFLLRGGLDYKRMNAKDRMLMYLLVKSLKSKNPDKLDNDAKGIIATYGKTVDFTNKSAIAPIVAAIKA